MPPADPGSIVLAPPPPCAREEGGGTAGAGEIEGIVREVTDAVMAALEQRKGGR